MKPVEYRKYLYEYYHEGEWWSFTLQATSMEDAALRLRQLQYAKLSGRVEAEIPARIGFIARALCRIRNYLAAY